MTQLDLRPLSVGEILDRTFTLYRRHFLIFVGITALPQLIVLAFTLTQTFIVSPGRRAPLAAMFSGPALLLLLAGVLVLVVASLFAQGATFLAVSDLYLSRPVKISDCLRRAWSEILTVFAVGILSGLAIVAGLICLIVPGIYIMCRLIVSVPSALIEQRGPAEAVGRSWRLTAGNAGRAFVVIFVYFVIAMAAAMLVQLPFTIALFMVRNNLGLVQVLTAVAQVGSSVVNTIVSPIFMIATSVFYFDLRVRKEGFDLQFMMDPTSERLTPPGTGSIPSILS